MAQTLDQIGQVKGPIEEFPNPHPTPELSTKIEQVAILQHAPLAAALQAEGPALSTVKNATSTIRADYETARSELDAPRNELAQASFDSELAELQVAEAARPAIDGELAQLAALNPSGATLPPITFSTPELDAVEQGYTWMDVQWDWAWPLWPFVAPG